MFPHFDRHKLQKHFYEQYEPKGHFSALKPDSCTSLLQYALGHCFDLIICACKEMPCLHLYISIDVLVLDFIFK